LVLLLSVDAISFVEFLPGILQRRGDRLDLDVGELTVHPAHFAQVLVLDDVARVGVD